MLVTTSALQQPVCCYSRSIPAALAVGLSLAASGWASAEASESWAGTWQTQWRGGGAILRLQQEGDKVTGVYPLYEGRVEGRASGRKLEGRWFEESGREGTFLFSLSPEGDAFMGRSDGGEWWTGSRLSDSHDYEVAPANLSSPRETMRSFMTAANAARSGFIERIRPALDTIDFSHQALQAERGKDGSVPPRAKLNYARQLFRLLDELTFQIRRLPGPSDPVWSGLSRVTVSLGQAGSSRKFELAFVQRGDSWLIEPPAPEVLAESLVQLYERRQGRPPAVRGHLQLRHPRATMRTFLEEMRFFDAGGRDHVVRSMDLENLEESVQREEERLLAHYLKQIIDRIGFVIYQEIPNDPDQPDAYVHFRHGAGNIVIAPFTTDDGNTEWRFTADTLRSLRSLYTAIEDMPAVEGVYRVKHPSAYFAIRSFLRGRAPVLLQRVGLLEGWQWLSIVLFLLTSVFLAYLLTGFVLWLLRRRGSWLEAIAAGRIRIALVWPLRMTLIGLLWYLKVGAFGLPEVISDPVRSIAASVAIASGLWLSYRGIGLAGEFSNQTIGTSGHKAVFTSLSFGVLRIVLVVAAALLLAEAWDLPYSSVLAGLGVGGLALALAAKQTVQNMIAGFTLFADNPLSVGDLCRYGGKLGTVEQIGLRSTRIRSRDRTVVSVPNAEFANMQLENFAKRDRILLRTTLGLRYETTPEQLRFVLAELRRLLIGHPRVDRDPARVRFVGFGAYSVDLEVYAYVLTPDWNEFLGIQEDLFLRMMKIVSESGTQFAFPSQVNYLARDAGNDAALTRNAEETVAAWRQSGNLPFPDFSPADIEQSNDRLEYPPPGAPDPNPHPPSNATNQPEDPR